MNDRERVECFAALELRFLDADQIIAAAIDQRILQSILRQIPGNDGERERRCCQTLDELIPLWPQLQASFARDDSIQAGRSETSCDRGTLIRRAEHDHRLAAVQDARGIMITLQVTNGMPEDDAAHAVANETELSVRW